jgi:SPP1 family predicted phage head-tail adaptor
MARNAKIRIQRPSEGQAPDGQPLADWADIGAAVWADIRDVGGREFIAAGAERSEVTTRIRIWRHGDIDADMRVMRGDVIYAIKAVLDEGRDTTLLMCTRSKP